MDNLTRDTLEKQLIHSQDYKIRGCVWIYVQRLDEEKYAFLITRDIQTEHPGRIPDVLQDWQIGFIDDVLEAANRWYEYLKGFSVETD